MQRNRTVQIPLLNNPYTEGIQMSDFKKLPLDLLKEYAIYYRLPRASELSADEIYSLLRGHKWIPALKHHVWIPRPDYMGVTVSRDIEDLEKWYTAAEERAAEQKTANYTRDPWATRNHLRKQWATAQNRRREGSTSKRSEDVTCEVEGPEVETPANIPSAEPTPVVELTEAQIALSKARKALTSSNTYRRIGRRSIVLEGDILLEAKTQQEQRQQQNHSTAEDQTHGNGETTATSNLDRQSTNQTPSASPPRTSPKKSATRKRRVVRKLPSASTSQNPSQHDHSVQRTSYQEENTSDKSTTTTIPEVEPSSASSPPAHIPASSVSTPEQSSTFSDHKRLLIRKADPVPLPELTFEARNKKETAAPPQPPLRQDLVYIACTLRSKNKDEQQAMLKGLHDEKKHSDASTFTNGFKLMFPGALSHAVSSGAYAAVSSIQNIFGSQRSSNKRSRAQVDDDAEEVRQESDAVHDDLPVHMRKRARCDAGPSRTHIRAGPSSAPSDSSMPVFTSPNLLVPQPRKTVDRLAGYYRVDEAGLLQSHAADSAAAGVQAGPSSRRPVLHPSSWRKTVSSARQAARRNAKRKRT
ncbi:hypothetical protein JR316_0012250 [Psilocybe cubensis]|uniref:Uncharacterized protein n=2 Tax=Psilocybe cubensis TaxID=181762 RepID=A0A8H8CG47_PSICU|nr:hypothetical protein JR316_0012250 [Psilocybe cubensis]KAH9475139.1 hypothetical protein JR316_0012250 [Psilocybe cubensis]